MKPITKRFSSISLASAALAAVAGISGLVGPATTPSAQAATIPIWADSNVNGSGATSTFDWFTGGPNTQGTWTNGAPGSSNTTSVQFFDTTKFTNTVAVAQTSNINNGGVAFELQTLTLEGKGGTTAADTVTETIQGNSAGDALDFAAASNTLSLGGYNGTATLSYNINANIQLGTATSTGALNITGAGTSNVTIGGNISDLETGGGSVVDSKHYYYGDTGLITLTGTNTYTGGTTINNGAMLEFNSAGAATGTINVLSGGTAAAGSALTGSIQADLLNHISSTATGTLGLTANTSEALNFSNTTASLGEGLYSQTVTYSGTLTPNSSLGYMLGGGNGTLKVSSVLGNVSGPTNLTFDSQSVYRSNLVLSGLNTYTGVTTISGAGYNNGELSVSVLANGGTASNIGESSNAAANLIIEGSGGVSNGGGMLVYTGSGASTDRLFTIGKGTDTGASSGGSIYYNGTGTLTFSNTGAIAFTTPNTSNTLGLYATSSSKLVFDPLITNNGSGITNVDAGGTDSLGITLGNAANSYTGVTNFNTERTTYFLNHLALGGQVSDIGAATSAASNWLVEGGDNIIYTGSGDTTDRNMTVSGWDGTYGNQITIDNNGTGALIWDGSQTIGAAPSNINATTGLVLGGTTAATVVNEYNGVIANFTAAGNGTYGAAYNLAKSGTNTWALGGPNTYTGTTTISAGALLINGNQSTATGAVTVDAGATLGGSGNVGGSVTLVGAANLQPNFDSLTPTTKLTVGSLTASSTSTIDVAVVGSGNDQIAVTNALAENGILNITDSAPQNGTFQLFTFGSATGDFTAVNLNGNPMTDPGSPTSVWDLTNGGFTYTFTDSTGALVVSSVPEPAALGVMALMGAGILLVGRKRKDKNKIA